MSALCNESLFAPPEASAGGALLGPVGVDSPAPRLPAFIPHSELERLARHIAPLDLMNTPAYVVLYSDELPASHRPAGTRGYWSQRLDVALRYYLGNRWRGRGPCVVIDDEDIAREAVALSPDDDNLADTLYRQRMLGLLAHEFAHAFDGGIERDEVSDADAAFTTFGLVLACSRPRPVIEVPSAEMIRRGFDGHGPSFLRLAIHLAWRLEKATGLRVPPSLVFCARNYGLSDLFAYAVALDSEPEAMAGASLAEIKSTPLPVAFVDRWVSDMANLTEMEQAA